MKKIANVRLVGSLLILTILGCATAKKQETIIPPQEKKEGKVVKQTPKHNVTSKTTLIFNVSSCSWSYIDENGKLHAVSITDGKPKYISSEEVYYIDLMKTEIVLK